MWWVFPLIVGAMLWAAADTISDAVITDHTVQHDDEHIEDGDEKKVEHKLTGEQDAAVSFAVMGILGLFMHVFVSKEHIFDPTDEIVWLALIAGAFQCVSLIFLLKSFENSSSTVIVPLMQLNAVFVLPLSIMMTLLSERYEFLASHHKLIKPMHLVAFVLIFCGGFYPACDGKIDRFFSASFWKHKAVVQVLISDITIALYYILVSTCTSDSAGMSSTTFMILSIWGNLICFFVLFVFIREIREGVLHMVEIEHRFLLLSAMGEMLSLSGYYVISFSYHWYYNSGIVSAAEGSLNQFFNLILAIVFKRYFNFGRNVENVKSKLLSCLLVTSGLVLASVE